MRRFSQYAWFVLAFNLGVVLWGAYVRATGSGAGCGDRWPLCNGEVLPRSPRLETLIEFTHRATSGLALIFIVFLAFWAWRLFPWRHVVRRAAAFSLGFVLSEALIGAGLVLLGHVATNASFARGFSLGIHLTNTLFLLASLALTAWLPLHPSGRLAFTPMTVITACGILLIGVSGAIAALGDTLFGASTLAEGLRQDWSPTAHPFIRLRMLHPVLAVALAIYLVAVTTRMLASRTLDGTARRLAGGVLALTLAQIMVGAINILLRAPVPLQLVHLLTADLLWVTFVLLSAQMPTAQVTPGKLEVWDRFSPVINS